MYKEIVEKFAQNQALTMSNLGTKLEGTSPPPPRLPPKAIFGRYRDFLSGKYRDLTFQTINGLYRNTVMFRVIEKVVGDIMSGGYKVETGNDDANKLCEKLDKMWSITQRKNSLREYFTYGNSFDFLQWAQNDKDILAIKEMSAQYIYPYWDPDTWEVTMWYYYSGEYTYEPKEVVHTTYARPQGETWGISLMEPAAATLHLLLNSNTNVAILLDRFAVPIVHWMLDKGITSPAGVKERVTTDDIDDFLTTLKKQKSGDDIVTDASVKTDIMGVNGAIWNFDQQINFLNDQFFSICGVPAILLGFGGTNKEIGTRQMQLYYDTISEVQQDWGAQQIEKKYQPYCEANGFSELDFDIQFPQKEIEERSQMITWALPMYQSGVISLGEFRELFKMSHDKPEEKQVAAIPMNVIKNQLSQTYQRGGVAPTGAGAGTARDRPIGTGTTGRQGPTA